MADQFTSAQTGQPKAPKTESQTAVPGKGTGKTQTWWQINGQRVQFFIDEKKYTTIIYSDLVTDTQPAFELIGFNGETIAKVQAVNASTKTPVPILMYNRITAGKFNVRNAIPCFWQIKTDGIPFIYAVQPEISLDRHSERLHMTFWSNIGCRINEQKDKSDIGTDANPFIKDNIAKNVQKNLAALISAQQKAFFRGSAVNLSEGTGSGLVSNRPAGGNSVFVPCFIGIDCEAQPESQEAKKDDEKRNLSSIGGQVQAGVGISSSLGIDTGRDLRNFFSGAKSTSEAPKKGGPSSVLRPLNKNLDRALFHCIADPIPVAGIKVGGKVQPAPWDVVYIFHQPYEILRRNGPINEIVSTAVIVDNEDIINRPDCSFENLSTRLINGDCNREADYDDLFIIEEFIATKSKTPGGPKQQVTGQGEIQKVVGDEVIIIPAGSGETESKPGKTPTKKGKTGGIDNRMMIWINENKIGQDEETIKGGLVFRRTAEVIKRIETRVDSKGNIVFDKKTKKPITRTFKELGDVKVFRGMFRDCMHVADDNHLELRTSLHYIYQELQDKKPIQQFSGPLAFTPTEKFKLCKTALKISGATISSPKSDYICCDFFSGSNYFKKFPSILKEKDPVNSCTRGDDDCGGKPEEKDGTREWEVPGFWHPTIEVPVPCNTPGQPPPCKIKIPLEGQETGQELIGKEIFDKIIGELLCQPYVPLETPTLTPGGGRNPPGIITSIPIENEISRDVDRGLVVTGSRDNSGFRQSSELHAGEGPYGIDIVASQPLHESVFISDDDMRTTPQGQLLPSIDILGTEATLCHIDDTVFELIDAKDLIEQTGKFEIKFDLKATTILGPNVSLFQGIGSSFVKFLDGTGNQNGKGFATRLNQMLTGEVTYQKPDENGLASLDSKNATEGLNLEFNGDPLVDFRVEKVFGLPNDEKNEAGFIKVDFVGTLDMSKLNVPGGTDKPLEMDIWLKDVKDWVGNTKEIWQVTANRYVQFIVTSAKDNPQVALGNVRETTIADADRKDLDGINFRDDVEWEVQEGLSIEGVDYKKLLTPTNGLRTSFEIPSADLINDKGQPKQDGYVAALIPECNSIVIAEQKPRKKATDIGLNDDVGEAQTEFDQLVSAFQYNVPEVQEVDGAFVVNVTPDKVGGDLKPTHTLIPAGSMFPKHMTNQWFIDVVDSALMRNTASIRKLERDPKGVMLGQITKKVGKEKVKVKEKIFKGNFATSKEFEVFVGDFDNISVGDDIWVFQDKKGNQIAYHPSLRKLPSEKISTDVFNSAKKRVPVVFVGDPDNPPLAQICEEDLNGGVTKALTTIANKINLIMAEGFGVDTCG